MLVGTTYDDSMDIFLDMPDRETMRMTIILKKQMDFGVGRNLDYFHTKKKRMVDY